MQPVAKKIGMAQQLIELDANKDALDNQKMTPLTIAVSNNDLTVAGLLMKNGADESGGYTEDGEFPLEIAVRNGNKEMVQAFLANYPHMDLDLWNTDESGLQTPLDVAIQMGRDDIVDLLKKRGAMTADDKREEDNALGKTRHP
jgi:ankyrin repeat protein